MAFAMSASFKKPVGSAREATSRLARASSEVLKKSERGAKMNCVMPPSQEPSLGCITCALSNKVRAEESVYVRAKELPLQERNYIYPSEVLAQSASLPIFDLGLERFGVSRVIRICERHTYSSAKAEREAGAGSDAGSKVHSACTIGANHRDRARDKLLSSLQSVKKVVDATGLGLKAGLSA